MTCRRVISKAQHARWRALVTTAKASVASCRSTTVMKGAGALLPISAILLLALALGDVAGILRTGDYVANLVGANSPVVLLAPLIFLTSAFIAFSVGSSWGTFAIMIPMAIPM